MAFRNLREERDKSQKKESACPRTSGHAAAEGGPRKGASAAARSPARAGSRGGDAFH